MKRLLPFLFFPLLALCQTVQINQGAQTSKGLAPLTTGLTSINGDTTPAQTIQGAGTVSVATTGGVTTITGTGGGGGNSPPVNITPPPTTYQITATDFAGCVVLYSSGAAMTATMPATIPPAGQCVTIVPYGAGAVTVAHPNYTINGTAANITVSGGAALVSNNGAKFTSDGVSNMIMERYTSHFGALGSGTTGNVTFTIGTAGTLNSTGTGIVDANRLNGGAVPISATSLASNASGQLIVGTGGGGSSSWSAMTAPTTDLSLNMLAHETTLTYDYTTALPSIGGGFNIVYTQPGGLGGVLLNVATTNAAVEPLNVVSVNGNFRVDADSATIHMAGNAKFNGPVQLPAATMGSAPALATDVNGNIIQAAPASQTPAWIFYNSGISMTGPISSQLDITDPRCTANICTATTPSVDGTYKIVAEMVQQTPGVGCTTGQVGIQISYASPDNNVTYPFLFVLGHMLGVATNLNMANFQSAANGNTAHWVAYPMEFRAKAGVPIRMQVMQGTGSTCSGAYPIFAARFTLYGPLF